MKTELITNGRTEGPSRKKMLMLAIASLALFALVLTVCTCVATDDNSAGDEWYSGTPYQMEFTAYGSTITIEATNRTAGTNVSLADIPAEENRPWLDSSLFDQITEIEIIGFSGGNISDFVDYVNLTEVRGQVFWIESGSSITIGTQVGTWNYLVSNKKLTVSTVSGYEGILMPNYIGNNKYIPWRNVPTLAATEIVEIEGFSNCGWQAFIDITVNDKDSLEIRGYIYSGVDDIGYWQFTKADGILLIVYDPGIPVVLLGTMPTWDVDFTTGIDKRPWSHGARYGSGSGIDDWEWYQYVNTVKNRGFANYSDKAAKGMENALVASVGNIYTNADDTGTQTGEWFYVHSAPADYRFGIGANSLMVEAYVKVQSWGESRAVMPNWGLNEAPWDRLSYSWVSGVDNVYIMNYNGYPVYAFANMTHAKIYTTWYADTLDHDATIGEWIYDHDNKLFTTKAYVSDTEMPNWSVLFTSDERPWGRYTAWIPEVETIRIEMFSNISENAFHGFDNAETRIIVGAILNGSGVQNGEWLYNERLFTLTLEGNTSAVMKDYSATDPAPWNGISVASVKVVIVTGYTNIGTYAFYGFDVLETVEMSNVTALDKRNTFFDVMDTLQNVTADAITTIPDSMFASYAELKSFSSASAETIEKDAFKACTKLESFNCPQIKTINLRSFQNCSALHTVKTAESVRIYSSAFEKCSSLTSYNSSEEQIYLPKVILIDTYAFRESGVKDVYIGNITTFGSGDKRWNDSIFLNCTSLERFVSPSVTEGRTTMFSGCTNLKYFEATALTTTNSFSFKGFSNLEELKLTKVEYIYGSVFENCVKLKTVQLPGSDFGTKRCYLYRACFKNCVELETVNMESVYFSDNEAFMRCVKLTAASVNTLTTKCGLIEDYTFADCIGITGDVVLKNTGSIYSYAFRGCKGITSVDFSQNKSNGTYLEYNTFQNCTALVSVKMPAQYTSMGGSCFNGCTSLKYITVPGSTIDQQNIAAQELYEQEVALGHIDPNDPSMVPVPKNTISTNCTSVGSYAFVNTAIENMYLPQYTTSVGDRAFMYCYNLETVDLNDVVYLYSYAFHYCTALKTVLFGTKTLEVMNEYVFAYTAVESMTVSCVTIGSRAFEGCTQLQSINIKKTTNINSYCFNGCSALTTVEAGKLNIISDYAFNNCKMLRYVDLTTVTKIYTYSFYNCESLKFTPPDGDTPDVLENLLSIGTCGFAYCYSLESVNAPLCKSIGESSFYKTKVTSINMPSLETMVQYSFYQCTNLKTVYLENITLIGYRAFSGCSSLQRLIFSESVSTSLTLASEVFYQCTNLIGSDFKVDEEGEPYDIVPTYFGNVVSIGAHTFYSCNRLTEFTADKCATMDRCVFYNCKALKTVSLGNVQTAGQECFAYCSKLQTADMHSLKAVPYRLFYSCAALVSVNMPNITSVGQDAFAECTNLKTIGTITNVADLTYVTSISQSGFYNTGITEFKFGTKLKTISSHVFRYTRAESFVFPNSLTTLGEQIFSGSYTRTVVYPSSITSMSYYQFIYCSVGDGSRPIEIYFNGPLTSMNIDKRTPTFHFSTSITIPLNIYVSEDSDAKTITTNGSSYKRTNYNAPMATYTVQTGVSSENGETYADYSTITAINGSQIVLPYCTDYEHNLYEGQYFGVQGSVFSTESLGIPRAGEEGTATTYARSGERVHTYVQSSDETLVLMGNIEESYFNKRIEIVSTAELLPSGVELRPDKRSYSYGESVVVPSLNVNTYTISSVRGIYTVGSKEYYSFNVPTKGTFNLGCYLSELKVAIESHTVTITFVDGEDTYQLDYIFGKKFGELPGGNPAAGYKFVGWFTLANGQGEQITEDIIVQKSMKLYAYYVPMDYTIKLYSNNPLYNAERTVKGVYTLYREDGKLMYTDAENTTKALLYDPVAELPGYKISRYWVDGYVEIKEGESRGPESSNMNIEISWTAVTYSITMNFINNSAGGQELENVIITNLLHGHDDDLYDSGDVVSGIEYADLSDGYIISIPKHMSATFDKAYAVYRDGKVTSYVEIIQDPARNCQMVLKLDHFINNMENLEIQFNFLAGYYRTQFVYNDDAGKVLDSTTLIDETTAFITTPVTPYTKSGYSFMYWSVGDGKEYPADTDVEITSQLLSYAQYGMLVFTAIWQYKQYTIHYDLGEYTEGTKANDVVDFNTKFIPTTVSGYLGHTLVSWVWVKEDGTEPSSATAVGKDIIITKEIVDKYAYGKAQNPLDLKMLAIWDLREYKVTTTESASPRFEDIRVKYTGSFTLWDGTTARVPEGKSDCEFGAWVVDSLSYGNMATVTIDDTLAYIGDNNEGVLKFVISWIQTEYMVKYDFCGGKDPTGQLPTGKLGPYCIGDKFEPVNGGSLVKDGYTYDGWKLLETDFTPYSFASGEFDAAMATYADSTNTVTLYANWEQIKFKITYELEGGTRGEYAPTTATYGTEILISNPTKSGYTFVGWTATNISDQTVVKVGENWQRWDGTYAITYTMYKNLCIVSNGTVTFTANWTTLEYEVKYQPNCDNYTLGEKTERVKVGDKIILPTITGNTKTGYGWKGWGFDEYNTIESGIEFTASMTSYAVNNVITIYGVWEPVRYTISYTYYPEYGERTVNAEYGVAVKIPTIDRIGYTFLGWTSTDIDPSISYYSSDQMIWYKWDGTTANGSYFKNLTAAVSDGKVTLTGVWKENIYKLVYTTNATSAKDPIDDTEYRIGSPVTLVKTIEGSNNGKTFLGWTLKQGSTDIASFTEFTTTVASYADVTNSVHLYGVWSEGTYTVTVDLTPGCTPSAVPPGWTLTSTGVYTKQFDYNTKMDVVMEEWSKITLNKERHVFASWDYSNATVVADTLVTAKFNEVQTNMLYIFVGVILIVIVAIVIYTRIER